MSWNKDWSDERRDMPKVVPEIISKLKLDDLKDASLTDQKENDIDLIGRRFGRDITIEVKIRYKDYGDFLLETKSNTTTGSDGWIYKSQAEILVYAIIEKKSPPSINILNLPKLRAWWLETGIYRGYPEKLGKTDGLYETSNQVIPWQDISLDIIIYRKGYNSVDAYFQGEDYEYLSER